MPVCPAVLKNDIQIGQSTVRICSATFVGNNREAEALVAFVIAFFVPSSKPFLGFGEPTRLDSLALLLAVAYLEEN